MNSFLSIVVTISLFSTLVLVWRRAKERTSLPESQWRERQTSLSEGFLHLTFKEALNLDRAPDLIQASFLRQINAALPSVGDLGIVGFQVLDSLNSRGAILAKFPDAAADLMANGKAVLLKTRSGEELLTLVSSTGRKTIIANARKVGSSLAGQLPKIGSILIGAAHAISGYDNARNIKKINKKLDILISSGAREMVSELEAVYESFKESLVSNNAHDFTHLRHLRYKLKHLRCGWINQVEASLVDVENPSSRNFLERFFSTKKGTANIIKNVLTNQEEPLYLTRFALLLEQHLSFLLGEESTFEEVTIPDARRRVSEIRHLVAERKEWIEKNLPGSNEAVDGAITVLKSFEVSLGGDGPELPKIARARQSA